MTVDAFLKHMQADLKNEYKHMHFYLHAGFVLKGLERLYAKDWFKEQAESEMDHVRQFSEKIMAFGVVPTTGDVYHPFIDQEATSKAGTEFIVSNLYGLLKCALDLEKEVVKNYHERLKQAHELNVKTDANYDLILFYEEHVEHSQAEIDEIVKLLHTVR